MKLMLLKLGLMRTMASPTGFKHWTNNKLQGSELQGSELLAKKSRDHAYALTSR